MLALDVITKKLQNQSLEETKTRSIHLISPREGYKLSDGSCPTVSGQGKKLWTVSINKNTERVSNTRTLDGRVRDGEKALPLDYPVYCPHRKLLHSCPACGDMPHTPPAPPKKRHCRSLSVPNEENSNSSWQPQQSSLWKPVVVNPAADGRPGAKPYSHTVSFRDQRTPDAGFFSKTPSSTNSLDTTGHLTPCDFQTPPESPIPRPASASTCCGQYDGSFSPLGAPWLEHSPHHCSKYNAFSNRSYSMEERISGATSSNSVLSASGSVHSNPSSPHRHRVPRCKSQPSFLHDRKCGMKRRRDYGRPALDFRKMTETAYGYISHSHPVNTPDQEQKKSHFHKELESVMRLMPIASSPQDSDLAVIRTVGLRSTSPISEMEPVTRTELSACYYSEEIGQGPVKLIGDDEDNYEEEGVFSLHEELDIDQIESH